MAVIFDPSWDSNSSQVKAAIARADRMLDVLKAHRKAHSYLSKKKKDATLAVKEKAKLRRQSGASKATTKQLVNIKPVGTVIDTSKDDIV